MTNEDLSILIIEDDQSLASSLVLNLELKGFTCHTVDNTDSALTLLTKQDFDIVLCDFRLPEGDGISFIKECQTLHPNLAIILMTGFGDSDLALEAMRAGAYDYLAKPFNIDELILTLQKIQEREKLRAENIKLKLEIEKQYSFSNIIARSDGMKKIFDTVSRVAQFDTTVLIRGESGTGKELIARAIHHNSNRRAKPFVAINCGAIPENLIESELFGHRKGAFTDAVSDKKGLFEEADGGTILLDEIGEMPKHLQVKLLRVLQEQQIQPVGDEKNKSIDVRVLAATLRDLEKDVADGRFRDDLLYRLNVITITVPPLRERPEDIPALVEFFIDKFKQKLSVEINNVSPEAMRYLMKYTWKGNVRELENCIERSMVLASGDIIESDSLPENITNYDSQDGPAISSNNLSIKQQTKKLECELIKKALTKTKGNRTQASKILEISHRALIYKIKEFGLDNL